VAYALAEIGPAAQSATPALREAAKDRDGGVRLTATFALKKIDGH
jgi:HEAT repeat protein